MSLPTIEARAQDDVNATETAAARALALEGIKLADAGHCLAAIDKLARAEKLHHAPVVLGRLGECQVEAGKLVEGTETLRKVLREALPPDAPAVLLRARERAQSVLDKAKGRIGALNIVVKGPGEDAGVLVRVDGQPMNPALLGADRPTDPGAHFVEASAPGFSSASVRVSLGAGDKTRVVLHLEPDPMASSADPSVAARSPGASPAEGGAGGPLGSASPRTADGFSAPPAGTLERRDLTTAYVAWAAGGAALLAGSVFGVLAFQGKSDLEEQCPDRLCPPSSRDRLDSARRASTAANVSFALGALGLGLGTFFYFKADPSREDAMPAGAASPEPTEPAAETLRARAWIGLGEVGLSGEF